MAKYTVSLTKRAKKQLDKIADNIAAPIFLAINKLEDNPRPFGYIKLKGRSGYRIKVGDYRILYEIIDAKLIVEVVELGTEKMFTGKNTYQGETMKQMVL